MPTVLCENRTKAALNQALRQMLSHKPLHQIRVRELTESCAIRRQSFYYHFPDIYALFDWSLQQERADLLARQERYMTWRQALEDLLNHTARDRIYYRALLQYRGRDGLRDVLTPALEQILEPTLEYYQRRCGAGPLAWPSMDCWETLLLTWLEGWIQGESQEPGQLLSTLDLMIRQGAVGAAWQNLPAQPNGAGP